MKIKVFDIVQPKDDWERAYARMEFLRGGLYLIMAKRIEVSFE